MAHQARAYPSFCSMKQLGVFLFPLDERLVHRRVTPSIKFAGNNLYTWVERGTVRVKCLAQEHNTMCPWPGLKPGLLNPETSALTMRPPRLHNKSSNVDKNLLDTFQKPVKSSFVFYEAALLILSPRINTNYNVALQEIISTCRLVAGKKF